MKIRMMRNFNNSRVSTIEHPFLSAGNLVEGVIGIGAICLGVYAIFLYGFSFALILNLIYIIAVTAIALMSAYHLM